MAELGFGWFGKRTKTPPTQTAGAGGTAVYGGYIDTREKDARLIGEARYRTFSDILVNVSIVAASVRWYLNLVAKVGWKVEPAPGGGRANEVAELVEEMLYDMTTSWRRAVRRAAGYKLYGFGIQEWTAKRRKDGVIGLRDLEPRPQFTIERWDLDATGTVLGVGQRSPQTGQELYIPRGKMVYLVDDALNDSPEGLGLLRHAAEPGLRLMDFQLLEAYGYDTDLRGIPVARAPLAQLQQLVKENAITEKDRDTILAPIKSFVEKHRRTATLGFLLDSQPFTSADEALTPSGDKQYDLELLRGDSSGSMEVVARYGIERINRELARIFGTEHLLLGSDSSGSFALSKSKVDQFALMCDSALVEIAEQFEKDLVRPLFLLNGWPEELAPTLKTDPLKLQDVAQVTGALAEMAQAGAVLEPGDPAVDEVRDLLGLSRPPTLLSAVDASLARPRAEGAASEEELPPTEEEEEQEASTNGSVPQEVGG